MDDLFNPYYCLAFSVRYIHFIPCFIYEFISFLHNLMIRMLHPFGKSLLYAYRESEIIICKKQVSIPYRYDKIDKAVSALIERLLVSIPYRYDKIRDILSCLQRGKDGFNSL